MTAGTPVFGPLPDLQEYNSHVADFDHEMHKFVNSNGDRAERVNILHLSTDLAGSSPEMGKIVEFMRDRGYAHTHDPNPDTYADSDMVIVGSDDIHIEDVGYIVQIISRGFLGLIPHWDVLVYGTNGIPQPDLPSAVKPACANRAFSADGIGLAHAHIRRRDDLLAQRGLHLSLQINIDGSIDAMLGTWKMRNYMDKIGTFKEKIKVDGRWNEDAEFFFAAVEALRTSRNVGSHPLRGVPRDGLGKKAKEMHDARAKFDKLAQKYRRPFGPPRFASPKQEDLHKATKWVIRISQMAVVWVEEYSRLPRPN